MTERLEGTTISDALKLELLLTKDLLGPGIGEHTLASKVAHLTVTTSPLDSQQKITPKAYMICPPFDVCKKVANSPEVRGLSAKVALPHLEKGSDE